MILISTDYNDLLLAEGDDARKINEQPSGNGGKVSYVRLGDGESIRGFLLATSFKMFIQHNDFEKHIKSHTCTDPRNGVNCISCQHKVAKSKMTIVPFYDVDAKEIRVWLGKKTQMSGIYNFIDQYGDDALNTPITFTRKGKSKDTTYTPMPLPPKAAKELTLPDGIAVTPELYASVIRPPDADYVYQLLGLAAGGDTEATPLDGAPSDDELPF